MTVERLDALIIGSGQGGTPLAVTLARAGWTTALVEREHAGGTCINEGCTPTKTMIASARAAYMARRAGSYGVQADNVRVDMRAVVARKRAVVDSFRAGSERRVRREDRLEYIEGEARFVGPKEVEVALNGGGSRRLKAEHVVINTGARPALPDLPGLDTVPVLNSTTVMDVETLPEHMIIVGGGYVGLEFAQMFCRFGSAVTLIHRGQQVLSQEDPDIAEEITRILREDGIEILLESYPVRVQPDGAGVCMIVHTPDGERVMTGSHLLVATGRKPNTDRLNLEATGVKTDSRGYIEVNERLETNCPGVYALGDVNGGPAFTHISYDDYRILRDNLLNGGTATRTNRLVPYVIYIDPQLGRVGLTETEARKQGRNIRVASIPMNYVSRAVEVDEPRGLLKAVVDADSGQILGCAMLGIEGGELMSMLEIAMMGGVPYTKLRDATFAHPSLAESLNTLFAKL